MVPPKLSNSDIRVSLIAYVRAMTTQENLIMVPRINVVERTITSRLIDIGVDESSYVSWL